jgi:deazaflavin-dependent oxidoreductase (nitroreductase family)
MTAPPELSGIAKSISDASQSAFLAANRYLMGPLHRAGLSAWLGNPVTGWQCLLTTTGRRSGLPREAPLGYIVMDGAAWVLAGYGPKTQWYRNVLADSRVRLRLPARESIEAVAEEASDPEVRARVIPPLMRSMALPGSVIGCFPPLSTDERILQAVSFVPLVRVSPADGSRIDAGPDDPGGHGWVWRQSLLLSLTVLGAAAVRRLLRRR